MRRSARIVLVLAARARMAPAFDRSPAFINEIHYDNRGAGAGSGPGSRANGGLCCVPLVRFETKGA
jgi:hypothetical protein